MVRADASMERGSGRAVLDLRPFAIPGPRVVYTVGHSNRELEEFLSLLERFQIDVVADVRRFPTSRKFPHFSKESLRDSLAERGIAYVWLRDLGGYRGRYPGAEEIRCFRAQGYRNYAAYMSSEEWRRAFSALVRIAGRRTVCIMCAERIPWRCHRKLISDALLAAGFRVLHIIEADRVVEHRLTKCARVEGYVLRYV